jgi:hypothetical protein
VNDEWVGGELECGLVILRHVRSMSSNYVKLS